MCFGKLKKLKMNNANISIPVIGKDGILKRREELERLPTAAENFKSATKDEWVKFLEKVRKLPKQKYSNK